MATEKKTHPSKGCCSCCGCRGKGKAVPCACCPRGGGKRKCRCVGSGKKCVCCHGKDEC